jgi:hypothetical protein
MQAYVRDHASLLGYQLSTAARGFWRTSNGGTYSSASAGQNIRGLRAQVVIVDDPFGGRADAESEVIRNDRYHWSKSDVMSRPIEPTDDVVLTSPSYHEEDLMTRLIREEAADWIVLRIPAISECEGDPLGRPEGEPLAAGLPYGAQLLARKAEFERIGFEREWQATYQGSPQPPLTEHLGVVDYLPPGRTLSHWGWDLAASSDTTTQSVSDLRCTSI